jgi:hypothetical protein
VRCRVDEEGGVVHDDNTEKSTPDETPKESRHAAQKDVAEDTREHHTNEETKQEHVTVLESKDWIVFEIVNFLNPRFAFLCHHYPSNVSPKESFEDTVWVVIGVGHQVMASMVAAPLNR